MAEYEPLLFDDRFSEFLHDESGLVGSASGIWFPESEEDVARALAFAAKRGSGVCVQGARTGLMGGAVPEGGLVLNLSGMKRIEPGVDGEGNAVVDVGPGVTHAELRAAVSRLEAPRPLFWPPDPTETSATIGGAAACNSRGLCSLLYGRVGDHLAGARVVGADGAVVEIAASDCDGLSQYVGAEGRAGVFSLLRLRLAPRPAERWGIVFFFSEEEGAAGFVDAVRGLTGDGDAARLAAVEFMDAATMALLRGRGGMASALKKIPEFPADSGALAYLELHADGADAVETLAGGVMDLAAEAGSDPDSAWAATSERDVERLREMRHAATEMINRHVVVLKRRLPGAVRQVAAMRTPGEAFAACLRRYRVGLREAGLAGCVFGHAGENRLDAALLPADAGEYERGGALLRRWAEETAGLGGDVVSEYGAGRIGGAATRAL